MLLLITIASVTSLAGPILELIQHRTRGTGTGHSNSSRIFDYDIDNGDAPHDISVPFDRHHHHNSTGDPVYCRSAIGRDLALDLYEEAFASWKTAAAPTAIGRNITATASGCSWSEPRPS